jgi:hypothetical protein
LIFFHRNVNKADKLLMKSWLNYTKKQAK